MSKRKVFSIVLLAVVAALMLACAVFFTACGNNETPGGGQNTEQGGENPGGDDEPGTDLDDDKDIAVTTVSLDKNSLTLRTGESYTLIVTVSPSNATDKSIIWSSANSSVASVSGGKVTAKSEGATTITATAHNGKTAICTVIVNEPAPEVIEVTSVALNKTSLTLEIGASETLTATVSPSNATDKSVTWTSSDQTVATVANGNITAVGSGTATITAETHNGKSANCEITVEKRKPLEFGLTSEKSFYTVIKYNGTDTTVEIPRLYNGLRVTAISANAFEGSSVKKVILPNTIESIGSSAFSECSLLQEINIPDSVKQIGEKAFYNCASLKTINKITNIQAVSAQVFSGCSSLQEITFGPSLDSIGSSAFEGCTSLQKVVLDEGVTAIGDAAFDNCISLTDITLPKTLTRLGTAVFRHAESLQVIEIPSLVTAIPNVAFQYCTALNSIVLPKNVINIGASAFSYCTSLQSAEIRGNIETFGNSAFYECTALTAIYYGSKTEDSVVNRDNYIFYNAGTAESGITLTIGKTAKIPEGLFQPRDKENVPKIVNIIWEEGVQTIDCFEQYNYLPYLKSVSIPAGVFEISDGLLEACSSITETAAGITYLDNSVISCDENVQYVSLREGTNNILKDVFTDHSQLISLVIPDSVSYISAGILSGCSSLEELTVPFVGQRIEPLLYQYPIGYIFGATSYEGGVSVRQEYRELVGNTESFASSTYYFPATLKTVNVTGGKIFYGAFYNCSELMRVTIPDGTVSIEDKAFYNCSELTEFIIPDSVSDIGSYAFYNCSALAKIIIPFGVTSIGNNAFGGCSLLTLYTILSEKPAGWASNWNGGCTIEWETGSDTPSVYHFVANGGTEIEDIVSNKIIELPVPEKFGYTFVGWFDNPELEGTVYSGKYYSPNDVTFYAKWDEYQIQSEGLSIKNGMIVGIGSCTDTELVLDMPVAEGAFIGCHTITKVTFGPGVTSIGDQAFGNSGTGCDKLTEVVFLSPVPPEIGRDVFGSTWNHVAGFTVYVPTGSLAAYEAVDDTYWQEYLVYEGKIKEM